MHKKRSILLALLLIILGGYLLLLELDAKLPGWGQIWPVFPLAAGLALIVRHIANPARDPAQVFLGTAITLVSVVFFLVTMGPLTYPDLESWWPMFIIIGGVAFLSQWAADGFGNWDALFLGLVALIVGGVAFAVTFRLLGPGTREILPRLWPIALILVGLLALLRGLLGRRAR